MLFKSLFESINTLWCFIFITKHINGKIILFFYFYIATEITKKVYNNKIDTIFMKS